LIPIIGGAQHDHTVHSEDTGALRRSPFRPIDAFRSSKFAGDTTLGRTAQPRLMGLSRQVVNEVGRLLNGKGHPDEAAIAHLSTAAARSAESLVYLADIDDRRFGGAWPFDGYENDSVDDGHVRWAAAGALTSLDLCIAAAGRLVGFAINPPRKEDSIRDYYRISASGQVVDNRNLVAVPWRAWIDCLIADPRYTTLLRVRNALMHADAFRVIHGTTGVLAGHALRFGYNTAALSFPSQTTAHTPISARDVVVLARDVAWTHVNAFAAALASLP
jgi:hypothetical protein